METQNVMFIASVAHEANRLWCAFNGDRSQPSWEAAPDWQRDSAAQGVRFHINNPEASDSASHDNWMAQKTAEGWTYGEIKDPVFRTHPCLVRFEDLPPVQQHKDRLFRTIVRALI